MIINICSSRHAFDSNVLPKTLQVRFFILNDPIKYALLDMTVSQKFYHRFNASQFTCPPQMFRHLKYLIRKLHASLSWAWWLIIIWSSRSVLSQTFQHKCLKNLRFCLFLFILSILSFTNQTHVKLYKTLKTQGHILISRWTCRDFKNPGSFSFECGLWKAHLHVEN